MKQAIFLVVFAGMAHAATLSLDTAGADPTLTSPFFTFTTDSVGIFGATYTNASNPPMDFISLKLTAPFTSGFYYGPGGPKAGTTCDPKNVFLMCTVTFFDPIFTVVFEFSGLDATHLGLLYGGQLNLDAMDFEPNQTVSGAATPIPASTPEPGAFGLALIGFSLAGLLVGRKKLLELRVRA